MKNKLAKILLIVALVFLGSQVNAQDIIYGTVRTDGYQKITKGAFWKSRPEAKMVYEGLYPSGITVSVLESDYFVRFVDSEHNNFDRNYIVFPKGEKIYEKGGRFYAAICGNEIEFFQSVNRVVIQKETQNLPAQNFFSKEEASPAFVPPKNMSVLASVSVPYQEQKPVSIPVVKTNWKPLIIVGGVVLTVGTAYLIYSLLNKKSNGGIPQDAPPVGGPQDAPPVGGPQDGGGVGG